MKLIQSLLEKMNNKMGGSQTVSECPHSGATEMYSSSSLVAHNTRTDDQAKFFFHAPTRQLRPTSQ